MVQDVSMRGSSESLDWVFGEKFEDQILDLLRERRFGVLVEEQWSFDDPLEHLLVVFVVERRETEQHFVY